MVLSNIINIINEKEKLMEKYFVKILVKQENKQKSQLILLIKGNINEKKQIVDVIYKKKDKYEKINY